MEKALAYIRVSTDRQVRGSSLESQEKRVHEHVARKGYLLDKIFVEEGETAKTDKRTELQAMLNYVRDHKGQFSIVIFPKVDRFARYLEDYVLLKRFLREKGLRIESTDEGFDDSPSGRFQESMLAAAAQFDNDVRAERSLGGMREAILAGRWVWRAPIGYRNVRVDGKSTAEIDPITGPLVRQAFERMARREGTPTEIRNWLAANGAAMVRSYFHRMLHNRIYIGIIDAFSASTVALPPLLPLVTEAVFYAAQQNLRPKRMPKTYQRDREDFPLRGTLRCQTCLKFMTAGWALGRHRKYAYYRCQHCPGINLPKSDVERLFMTALQSKGEHLHVDDRLMSRLIEYWDTQQLARTNRRKQIENDIQSFRQLQKGIAMQSAKGVVPDDIAKDGIQELEGKIRLRYADHADLPTSGKPVEVLEFSRRFLSELPACWQEGSLPSKKRIQRFFYPEGATVSRQELIGTEKTDYSIGLEEAGPVQLSSKVPPTDKSTNHESSIQHELSIEGHWDLLLRLFQEFSLVHAGDATPQSRR